MHEGCPQSIVYQTDHRCEKSVRLHGEDKRNLWLIYYEDVVLSYIYPKSIKAM